MPEENEVTNTDTAEKAPEVAKVKKTAKKEQETANDDVKVEGEKENGAPAELEPLPVSNALTIECQIEAWRDQANDVCLAINKTEGHQPQFEKLLNKIVKKINQLNEQYAKDTATEGYQMLIERKPSGQLIVEMASSAEAYGFRDDLEAKLTDFLENDNDSLIEVTSSKSVHTKTAKILISSIAGYAIQSYMIYKDYASPRKLLPLDELVLRQPMVGNASNNRALVR